jgi:hypothetical protein
MTSDFALTTGMAFTIVGTLLQNEEGKKFCQLLQLQFHFRGTIP